MGMSSTTDQGSQHAPTQQQVLDAFEALGGQVRHIKALTARLEQDGFDVVKVAEAVDAALKAGVLVMDRLGSIHKS